MRKRIVLNIPYGIYVLQDKEMRQRYKSELLKQWKKGMQTAKTMQPYEVKYIKTICKRPIEWGYYL